MIWVCRFEPDRTGQWDSALIMPSETGEKALRYVFEQIGSSQGAGASASALQDEPEQSAAQADDANAADLAVPELETETVDAADDLDVDSSTSATVDLQVAQFYGYERVDNDSFLRLPLTDREIKFAVCSSSFFQSLFFYISMLIVHSPFLQFLKRMSQLSGHFFPDSALSSFKTVDNVLRFALWSLKPKPKKLSHILMQDEELRSLPNVKIFDRRQTAFDRDEELGRKKIIERELRARGYDF